jgi:PAT family beta-lactamase induction signal transducer AmpG
MHDTSPNTGRLKSASSPWTWVPSLYFVEALPNLLAVAVYPTAFKSLGYDNLTILSYMPLVQIPWTLKLLWAPLVEVTARKRSWTLAMQGLVFVLSALCAAGLLIPDPFKPVLAALLILAFASATHDIAADGLYLLALDPGQQAKFVGVLTTASRLAKLFCTGLLVFLAGYLISEYSLPKSTAWAAILLATSALYGLLALTHLKSLPRVEPLPSPAANSTDPGNRHSIRADLLRTLLVLLTGGLLWLVLSGYTRAAGHCLSTRLHIPAWEQTPGALKVWLILAVLATLLLPPALLVCRRLLRNTEIGAALASYVTQPRFGSILFFILTYRLGEVMVGAVSKLFLLDPIAKGGLQVGEKALGQIDGVTGVTGIILGGLLGGPFIARVGLRRAFWPLAFAMHTPNLLYVYAAFHHTSFPTWQLYPLTFIDQFGYGFGFAGYFVYLMQVAQRSHGGAYKTTHYAIGTGLGALTILLATALSGILQSALGYTGFFIAASLLTIPGMAAILLIPLDSPHHLVSTSETTRKPVKS